MSLLRVVASCFSDVFQVTVACRKAVGSMTCTTSTSRQRGGQRREEDLGRGWGRRGAHGAIGFGVFEFL